VGITKTQKVPQRMAIIALGWIFIFGGVVELLIPLVPGGFLIVAGALILSPQCPWLRRTLEKCRARFSILERAVETLPWGDRHSDFRS
jgi:hypothetical protein